MKQLFGLLVIVLILGLGYWFTKKSAPLFSQSKPLSDDVAQKRLSSKIKVLQKFLDKNPKYNNELVFLADLKIMSGKNRFFCVQFETKQDNRPRIDGARIGF
jgi:hypothetical protein